MRHPGQGVYSREAVPKPLRKLCPAVALDSALDVDLEGLAAEGRKLVLLDVDNTIMAWRAESAPPEACDWIQRGKDAGLEFCILSNTRRPERLARIAGELEVEFIRDKFKPNPQGYLLALERFNVKPEEAVMIGDQLLTDVFGASRAGIDSIWVQRLSRKEFLGTKLISRNVERIVGLALRRWFQSEADSDRPGFFQKSVVRQLVKFGIVGGTATFVDLGLHNILMFRMAWDGVSLKERVGTWVIQSLGLSWPLAPDRLYDAAFVPLKVPVVMLAIMVSYLLNWAWTFRQPEAKLNVRQGAKFYIVALVGMVISITAGQLTNLVFHADVGTTWALASFVGMVTGFIWNFNVQRRWTFRAHE